MRSEEQKLWDRMREALRLDFYMERIENAVASGRPDVDVMWRGITIPIELKARPNPPIKSTTPVLGVNGLNLNQLNWWLRWQQNLGRGFILIGISNCTMYAVPGRYSESVNFMTLKQLKPFEVAWREFADNVRREVREVAGTI